MKLKQLVCGYLFWVVSALSSIPALAGQCGEDWGSSGNDRFWNDLASASCASPQRAFAHLGGMAKDQLRQIGENVKDRVERIYDRSPLLRLPENAFHAAENLRDRLALRERFDQAAANARQQISNSDATPAATPRPAQGRSNWVPEGVQAACEARGSQQSKDLCYSYHRANININTIPGQEPTTLAGAQYVCGAMVDSEAQSICENHYREKFNRGPGGRLGELMDQERQREAATQDQRQAEVLRSRQRDQENLERTTNEWLAKQRQAQAQAQANAQAAEAALSIFGAVLEANTERQRRAPAPSQQQAQQPDPGWRCTQDRTGGYNCVDSQGRTMRSAGATSPAGGAATTGGTEGLGGTCNTGARGEAGCREIPQWRR